MKAQKGTSPSRSETSPLPDAELIQRIARRVFVHATKMIYEANHRTDQMEGDPKVGGHPAACSSCVHIMSALHLGMRQPQDLFAIKPHASPVDHSVNQLLGLFHSMLGQEWLSEADSKAAMWNLRKFSQEGEPVFQSYHAEADPDGNAYFPSGSVGIPPVVSMYTALAYRYAEDHGLEVPKGAYFWSLMGDSEFREGSLMEALPDASERELGNVVWIVDYNRQNLDGTRIPNPRGLRGTDAQRMERVGQANGWEVIQVVHGSKRLALFKKDGGAALKKALEEGFSDFEFQMLLLKRDGAVVRERLVELDGKLKGLLKPLSDADLYDVFADLGGHDVAVLLDAFQRAKQDSLRPTLVICHTIKGWGLSSYAAPGNHSALPDAKEVEALLESEGLSGGDPFARFGAETKEGKFLARRGAELRKGIEEIWALKNKNASEAARRMNDAGGFPETLGVDLKLTPLVHTQYIWGQLAGKMIRIGNRHEVIRKSGAAAASKEISEEERRWGPAADLVLTMAPDVGTSTNINPAMDEKIYGPEQQDYESELGLRQRGRPVLIPHEEAWTRHIRFEIAEANCMSAAGAFGKLRDHVGIPFLPIMTIYDFFIKRAYDQLYYNLYWRSGFIVVGTPSGTTLSPEGAQHSWKSDIQMPNLITWEPFFALEVDWILSETVRRHYTGNDAGRTGVLIRAVTKAVRQNEFVKRLQGSKRFEGQSEEQILEATRKDTLEGAYYLVDWRGYADYTPGDNVVHLFAMGAMVAEALKASDRLRADGIFANVIVVTSNDLLAGNLAHENDYRHLRQGLAIDGDLHLTRRNGNGHGVTIDDRPDLVMAAARRVPLVTVADGEPGLLDNLGSIVGVKSEDLAVRKASKSGRPVDVYGYLHIDADAIYDAAGKALSGTAVEEVRISRALLEGSVEGDAVRAGEGDARGELWPPRR